MYFLNVPRLTTFRSSPTSHYAQSFSNSTLIRSLVTVCDNDGFPGATVSKDLSECHKDSGREVDLARVCDPSFLMMRS